MAEFQRALAIIALLALALTLGSTLVAIWFNFHDRAVQLIELTELILSWKVVGAGFVFGGGQALLQGLRNLFG